MTVTRTFSSSSQIETGNANSYLESSFLYTRPRRHTSVDSSNRPGPAHRARSASNILDDTDEFNRRLYDPVLAPHLQKRSRNKDGLTDLADFLKNQAPPPDHFMSIPDHENEDDRGRWLKWVKVTKRSKSAPRRRPPRIRLPDTAVSGTTIGGHRHIAITIPLEAFPLGDRPRSQYPVYGDRDQRGAGATSPVRTVTNDKGVVTVLKPVKEHFETPSSYQRRPTTSPYGHRRSYSLTPSERGQAAPPSRGSASILRGQDGSRQGAQGSSNGWPIRNSSMVNRTLHQNLSIDGLISQPALYDDATRPRTQGDIRATRSSSNLEKEPRKSVKVEPGPIVANGLPMKDEKKDDSVSKESGATLLKANPLGSHPADSGPPTPTTAQMRKDRVRERKRKDMEALWLSKAKQGSSSTASAIAKDRSEARSQPTFSPIRVVIDVEPEEAQADALPTPSQSDSTSRPTSFDPKALQAGLANSKPTVLQRDSHPTPPLSPRMPPSTTATKHNALDRTSLARRREWKATRDQERKNREARAAVRNRTKEVAASLLDMPREELPQSLDKEILRLYEAYREHRFQDMERRVRRLERNGDVWLRALIPVLKSLNRTTGVEDSQRNSPKVSPQDSPRQGEIGNRVYLSDEEDDDYEEGEEANGQLTEPRSRATSMHEIHRANRALQEMEMGYKMDGADDSNGHGIKANPPRRGSKGVESVSGLETIEPLMRELAGAAEWRQLRSSGLVR